MLLFAIILGSLSHLEAIWSQTARIQLTNSPFYQSAIHPDSCSDYAATQVIFHSCD